MKILVACEFSGKVRDAFIAKGHDAMSCDILPTDKPGPHYEGDIFDVLYDDWDMVIAFPPCTHLASSGAKHFAKKIADGRQQQGIDFFMSDAVTIDGSDDAVGAMFIKPVAIGAAIDSGAPTHDASGNPVPSSGPRIVVESTLDANNVKDQILIYAWIDTVLAQAGAGIKLTGNCAH